MLSSPRRPSNTMRIFSSAEYCLRVARRVSWTTFSAGSLDDRVCCLIFAPCERYDEPETLPSSICQFCLTSADGGHSIVALLLYRTLGGTPYLSDVLQITAAPESSPLRLWLAVAFVAGYVPDFGLSTLVRYLHITYLKNVDGEVMKSVAIIPIEIVDGIDYDVRYRLEETNIVDIQNLATYNPILLFVETPYGLYEAFDWVLQAQLCLAVGPKTFLELKKYKLRTIFDLEKAVTGDGTDGLTRMIGTVLYTDADPQARKFIAAGAADPDAAGPTGVVSIRRAVNAMGDNLHTQRLRQLWAVIYEQLTPAAAAAAAPRAAG